MIEWNDLKWEPGSYWDIAVIMVPWRSEVLHIQRASSPEAIVNRGEVEIGHLHVSRDCKEIIHGTPEKVQLEVMALLHLFQTHEPLPWEVKRCC